ncbi:MAG: SRPBCC family protein [Pseudomonadota bacterium]
MIRTAALAAVFALLTGVAQAGPLPTDADKTLRAGLPWITVGLDGDAALIHAAIDIPAPAERIWKAMTDCRYAAKLVANVTRCRILSQGPGWDVREHVTSGNMIVPTIRNVFRSDYEPYRRIRFHRVDGDLKAMQGEWGLTAFNGGKWTRVTYENRLAARILAPAIAVRAGLRKDTPKVLMNLRTVSTSAD